MLYGGRMSYFAFHISRGKWLWVQFLLSNTTLVSDTCGRCVVVSQISEDLYLASRNIKYFDVLPASVSHTRSVLPRCAAWIPMILALV
jgi:hypothetical protein